MQPQGTGVINSAFFNNLAGQINALDVCSELQVFTTEVMSDLQAQITAIEQQIAALLPLITVPTDLASVITWISNFIAPQLAAYEAYATQLTQTLAAINNLVTAIENAEARITNCTITIPTITT